MRSVYCILAFVLLAVAGCSRMDDSLKKDELVVAVRNTPAFLQEDGGGFESDLIELLAGELGLKVRMIVVRDHVELMTLLKHQKVHFAASATVAEPVEEGVRYSTPLRESRNLLVQHASAISVDEVEDLAGKQIEVLQGASLAAFLKDMAAANAGAAAFSTVEQGGMGEIELLERVSNRKAELAATDGLHFDIAVNFFPDVQEAQVLPGKTQFVWAFPADGDPQLFDKAQAFIARIQQDGTLSRLNDRYFGHIHRLDTFTVSDFLDRIGSVLPRLRREFIAAQEITGIDWRLLAALAYQESRWNPLATSHTNVRGIMMLTEETADRMNVTNRLDSRQSIQAGAKYLAELIEDLPDDIKEPDRTWIGLAAYNIGQGHMNGARAIAKGMKRDVTSWYEMKQVLPLMARPEYYRRLKSGRARGGEAVIMVENVRKYYDILSRFEPAHKSSGAAPDFSEFRLPRCAPGQPCRDAVLPAR